MVDAHQDVMARITCGEGIPDFYAREASEGAQCTGDWTQDIYDDVKRIFGDCVEMDSYDYDEDSNGWPLIPQCNEVAFFKYYTTAESLAIFDALYTNKHNMTDKFVAYWEAVAQRLAKNPYVIGFDPINEPFPSDFIEDPSILQPGVFDREKLSPLYEKAFEKYYAANPKTIMYFETGQYPDAYQGIVNPAGFDLPPGGEINSVNHVLNDHSYCC